MVAEAIEVDVVDETGDRDRCDRSRCGRGGDRSRCGRGGIGAKPRAMHQHSSHTA